MTPTDTAATILRSEDADTRREAARMMGSATSERKRRTSAANGRLSKNGGRPPLPLDQIACTCGRGDALDGHPTSCPRGRAIRRREAAGKL